MVLFFDGCLFGIGDVCQQGTVCLGRLGVCFLASPFSGVLGLAPRPIAFRLRGQDPLLILALGDLQWGGGPLGR